MPPETHFHGTAGHQTSDYKISTEVYEGPLDLLLQLIERAELDITRVSLALVTDQFLDYIRGIQTKQTEKPQSGDLPPSETGITAAEVSAFLVIAARLLQIKSEVLLPRPPQRQAGDEDPGETLAEQLRAYKRFKELSGYLSEREANGLQTYLRLSSAPRLEGRLDLSELSLEQFVAIARQVFAQEQVKPALASVVAAARITIREKISQISARLRQTGRATFLTLFSDRASRLEIVVTFLAMLELVKQHFIHVNQAHLFGDISIEPSESWSENLDIELEFGE